MKIKSFIYTTLASALLFTSCDLNKQPVFDDDTQAYIAFSGSNTVIKEAVDGVPVMLGIPVLCDSKAGINAEVAFAAVDTSYSEAIRAIEGTDYRFVKVETYTLNEANERINVVTTELTADTEKTIKFDANHRFAVIYIETIDNDVEGGDKKFDVVLNNVQGCRLGASDVYAVTISDDEDPVNKLVGTYDATAPSAFDGYPDENWEVTITRDDEDPTRLWIHPACIFGGLSPSSIYPIYCTVDVTTNTLQMPFGQCMYGGEDSSYNMVIAGISSAPILTGVCLANFTIDGNDVTIEWTSGYGVGDLIGDAWWYQALQAPTFVKK